MKSVLKIENVDTIDATVTITMTIRHWKMLRDSLGVIWPANDLRRTICTLVNKAEERFEVVDEVEL